MRQRRIAWWLLVIAAASVAGCTESQSATESHRDRAGSAWQAVPLPSVGRAPAARDADAVVPQCRTSDLPAAVGPGNAAAGTVAFPIVFTNNGSGPCVLEGFPGVSYTDGPDGAPVGAPAARDGVASGPVQVAPGGQASALVFAVDVHNIPSDQCRPVEVPGLRIYPPDNTESRYVVHATTACADGQVTTAQLRVRAVVAGADGH